MKSLAILLSIAGLVQYATAGTKCYGLALGSGDESAAFQAGAIQALLENMPADQVGYHTVTGV